MGKQNEKLLKNIELYEQKKKAEQQKSKILGQKPDNRKTNSKEKANV
jgi:sulfopyruvate decarboxylase TPP-binding subunit|tara:strand:- start:179 stop:319 length:141 start_codon:yes stop_codon:yes gene_type:complete